MCVYRCRMYLHVYVLSLLYTCAYIRHTKKGMCVCVCVYAQADPESTSKLHEEVAQMRMVSTILTLLSVARHVRRTL